MKLQPVDELIALGHTGKRSLDCIMAVKLTHLPARDVLESGIQKAQSVFAKTGLHPIDLKFEADLEKFINAPLDSAFHLEVAIISLQEEQLLALKMSHLLGDAVSMLLWIKVLLGQQVSGEELQLKSYPPKKDSPYRNKLNSTVWPNSNKAMGAERGFIMRELIHPNIAASKLNDLMILALLDSIPFERKAIWIPVNARKNFWAGFGNGLSRLRVYPPTGNSVSEKLAHIRRQKTEASTSGEIALPPASFDISSPIHRLFYQAWIKRPWADWGSISLSHLNDSQNFFAGVEKLWGCSNIMPRHQAALFVFSQTGVSQLSLSYDANNVTQPDAEKLLSTFTAKFDQMVTLQ